MKICLDIIDVSYTGAGVGKVDGKVIFVPYTCTGDVVEVELEKETASFCVGKLLRIITPSKTRVNPPCPYFGKCGGCDFQHVTREFELQVKRDILKRELNKLECSQDFEIIYDDKRLGYRNKLSMRCKDGKLCFDKANSHQLIEIDNCLLVDKRIQEALPRVRKFLYENDLAEIISVMIRLVEDTIFIYLLVNKSTNISKIKQKIAKKLQFNGKFGLFLALVNNFDISKVEFLDGEKEILTIKDGISVSVDAKSFLQVNNIVAEKLYDYVLNCIQGDDVVNAYSGQGFLSALLAKKADKVFGIELSKFSHQSAEKLKNDNKIFNLNNFQGKVEDVLPKLLKSQKIDSVILDPAREGCDKDVINSLIESKIQEIVYISCNFSTLIRDLKLLKENYNIESVKVFDMFPSTANLETVVVLKRKN